MAIQDISNLPISSSFQNLLQVSGSVIGTATGSQVDNLTITASFATSASFATTAGTVTSASHADSASFATIADNATTANTASYVAGANVDGTVANATNAVSATSATTATSASFATTASFATSASYITTVVQSASYAETASYVETAQTASHAAASDVTFDDADFQFTASNVQQALDVLDNEKANLDQLSSNINLYPTTASSDIGGYFVLVENSSDSDYIQGGADVSTGTISGANQLISSLAVKENVFSGNPGILNITIQGQIRRTGGGGFSSADFYYEVYERIGATETLIGTSDTTREVNEEHYEEFNASAVIPERDYASNGRIVLKFYGNLVSGLGGNPSFDFLFGGTTPVRALFPVPATLLVSPWNGQFEGSAGITGSLNVSADVTASNFLGTASIASDLTSDANININHITASTATFTSASIGYLESITGSAKIIGDEFVVLNADTPTVRYAGLKVYDSGSVAATASFEWDGENDYWILVEESGNSGIVYTGMTGSKGNEDIISSGVIPKGTGTHQIEASNITDDGTNVRINGNLEATGSHKLINEAVFPETVLSIKGGSNNIIQVDNDALAAITGVSVVIDGNAKVDGNLEITGDTLFTASLASTASYVAASNIDGTVANATSASHALIADNAPVINSITYPTTDGTDGQAIVTDGDGVLTFQDIAGDPEGATDTGTTLSFDNAIGTIYNTAAAGATGNITLSTTDAVVGAAAVIFHEDSTEPTVSGMTVDKKIGSYDTDALNVITFVHLGSNHVLQTIAGADVTGIVTNSTDTYTSVDDVQHIITLTQAEYDAIGTPDANTFYIVT